MKKIFFIKSRMHKQGGLEKYLDRLARCFMQEGAEVRVLTSSTQENFSHLPYQVNSLCKPCPISWIHLLLFDRKVRKISFQEKDALFGFDRHFVELTHYRAGNGCHREYLEKRSQNYGFFRRALLWLNPLHWVTLLSEKKTLECPKTTIICNSFMVKEEFLKWYKKADSSRIRVIHNGVEWHEYEDAFQKREVERARFCFEEGKDPSIPHILFVGNEWGRKGVRLLLESLKDISSPFYCTILGKEKEWKRFASLVHSLQLNDKVTLIPYHEKVLPWYQRADIFVLPSLYDPFANVTVEALAMGLWVVTSSTNGGGEIIPEGKTGSVISSFDKEDWQRAIEDSLQRVRFDPQLKENIRKETKKMDYSHTLQAYVNLFCGEL